MKHLLIMSIHLSLFESHSPMKSFKPTHDQQDRFILKKKQHFKIMELNHAFKQILILLTLGCPLKFD